MNELQGSKRTMRKTKVKSRPCKQKNKKLAEKITQLENAEIIGAVRTSGFTIDELLKMLGKTEIKNDLEDNDNEI